MKSKRAIIMLALSVLLGIAAVLLAARWMGQQAASDKTTVLVASRDMELGQAITPTMLESVPWPKGAVPTGAFDDPKKLEGRVVRISIFKGEPVLAPKLAPEGTKAGLDSVIKEGHRAITVKVNEVVGVAGFLAPGSFVDLLVNFRDEKDKPMSRVVLERIMVLAIAQEAQRPDETKPRVVNAVTLEVTPEQAEKIDLARNIGTLSLILRNQVDTQDGATTGVHQQDLFAAPAPVAVVASAPAPVKKVVQRAKPRPVPAKPVEEPKDRVEVIRGLQKATADF
ncbi:Flp pilus assembly protein CpaB [Rhodoferax sp.]|uniref:Flp pilus assembly protein CpaB n=1 Tax=Rhodoferax sp. TaxID=50421 RepID=UPI002722D0ED|nr:Flp pilus assembly protein CpaB [Rhodoferax sp.]MDO9145789.1 Flp pilus assembly protein CpaB [Rhodoferax sp.]MDP2441009.1 Flp pilus assembly protein CpaB [Rhodoferax sp.]MDP3865525.1 Flp pilus assembly protein CpaB [Rhodoferax sp.]MDZ4208807.1 Flp pilus assembly protein CpaB [Rhodoferax sp.]